MRALGVVGMALPKPARARGTSTATTPAGARPVRPAPPPVPLAFESLAERIPIRTNLGHLLRQLLLLSALTVTLHLMMFQAYWYNAGDVVPLSWLLGLDARWVGLFAVTAGLGLLATGTTSDRLFPVFLAWVCLLIIGFSYEDSILNWVFIQAGVGLRGDRVNFAQIAAATASLALAAILHMNQLALGFRQELASRGIPADELRGLEDRTTVSATRIALMAGAAVVGAAFLLNIVEFALGQARFGIGGLAIAAGLAAVAALAWVSYLILRGGGEKDEQADVLASKLFKE